MWSQMLLKASRTPPLTYSRGCLGRWHTKGTSGRSRNRTSGSKSCWGQVCLVEGKDQQPGQPLPCSYLPGPPGPPTSTDGTARPRVGPAGCCPLKGRPCNAPSPLPYVLFKSTLFVLRYGLCVCVLPTSQLQVPHYLVGLEAFLGFRNCTFKFDNFCLKSMNIFTGTVPSLVNSGRC